MKFESGFCNDPCSPRGGFLKGKERKGKGSFVFQASFLWVESTPGFLGTSGHLQVFSKCQKKNWNRYSDTIDHPSISQDVQILSDFHIVQVLKTLTSLRKVKSLTMSWTFWGTSHQVNVFTREKKPRNTWGRDLGIGTTLVDYITCRSLLMLLGLCVLGFFAVMAANRQTVYW